jgi:hypothetical protein
MKISKGTKVLVASVSCIVGAATFIAATPKGSDAAVVPARDVATTAEDVCEPKLRWQCCVWVGYWSCTNNSWPKQTYQGSSECIGIAPGDPIPAEIQKDLDSQKVSY